jgi:hypothetical protein
MTRQIELLQVLHEIRRPDYLRHVTDLVSQSDFERTFFVLKQSHLHLQQADFTQLLKHARARHGHRIRELPLVFQETKRSENIQEKCRFITNPEHRFLVGLLLYLPDRQTILRFIRRHFDGDPVERIIKWITAMAQTRAKESEDSNVLGIRFDETSLLVLECLLRGLSFPAVKMRLKQEYEPEEVDAQEQELRKLCQAFKEHDLSKRFCENQIQAASTTKRPKMANSSPTVGHQAEAATRGAGIVVFGRTTSQTSPASLSADDACASRNPPANC